MAMGSSTSGVIDEITSNAADVSRSTSPTPKEPLSALINFGETTNLSFLDTIRTIIDESGAYSEAHYTHNA